MPSPPESPEDSSASSPSIGEAHRALRVLLAAWVAFALVGTVVGALLLAPALAGHALPIERADFVSGHVARVRLGAWLFAARGLGEVLACLGLVAFARRYPYQPGVVAATFAACAAMAAVAVDGSGAYLLGHVLPSAGRVASSQAGGFDLPEGGGLLGELAQLVEQLVGYGRQSILRDYLRVEALALRRIGTYGTLLHLAACIAIFAAAAAYVRDTPARALSVAAFLAVVVRAVAAGALFAAVKGADFGYPHLALGLAALFAAPLFDFALAAAVRRSVEAASARFAAGFASDG